MGVLFITFGLLVFLAGLYLVTVNKGDFAQVLLWKSNVKKMSKQEIKYAGKVTMFTSLSIIISGILALFLEESFIPVIVLIVTFVLFLIIGIKIFK
jgi:hypothetical protein